jgi:hypothetical protein
LADDKRVWLNVFQGPTKGFPSMSSVSNLGSWESHDGKQINRLCRTIVEKL